MLIRLSFRIVVVPTLLAGIATGPIDADTYVVSDVRTCDGTMWASIVCDVNEAGDMCGVFGSQGPVLFTEGYLLPFGGWHGLGGSAVSLNESRHMVG